jgi:diguanylate cyclase (GGDEF)-like protein/PAS domain S-box-containing protein
VHQTPSNPGHPALNTTCPSERPACDALDSLVRLAARCLAAPLAMVSVKGAFGERQVVAAAPEGARGEGELAARLELELPGEDGAVLGVLSVFDAAGRVWTGADHATMRDLAVAAVAAFREHTLSGMLDRTTAEYRELLDTTTELVCTADCHGAITYVNRAWCEAFGLEPSDVIGVRAVDLVAAEDRARYVDVARRLHAGEEVDEFEVVAVGHQGRRIVCRGNARATMGAGADGGRACLSTRAVYHDVTRERQGELLRARLVATLEATSDLVGVTNPDGVVEYLNRGGRRLLGLREDHDLSATHASSFHPPSTLRKLRRTGFPAALRDGFWQGTGELRTLSGERIPVSMSITAHPGLSKDDRPYFSAIMRDERQQAAADAAIRASESRLRAVMDNAAVGVSIVNDAGIFVGVNRAFEIELGYEPGTLVGRYAPDLSPPDDAAVTRGPVADLRAGRIQHATVEKRFVSADGSVRWAMLTLSRIPLGDGEFGILGLTSDITRRREMETQLANERAFLTATLDSLSDGVVACDANGELALFNRATREFHGVSVASLPPDHWSDRYRLCRADGVTPLPTEEIPLLRAYRGESVRDAAMVLVSATGVHRHVLVSGQPIESPEGETLGAVVAMRDVTQRALAEEALRQSEARYRQLVDGSPDGIVKHSGGVIRYANAAMARLVGLESPDALIGTPVLALSHPDDHPAIVERLRRVTTDGTLAPLFEERIVRAEGSHLHCEVSSAPMMVDGECGVLSVVRDISARRRTEAALRESEAAFRGLLETVRAIAVTLDVDGNVTFANDALLDLTGWPRAQVLGADWFARFVAQPDVMRRLFASSMAGEDMIAHYESEIVTRLGRRRLIVWDNTLLKDPSGAIVGSAAIGQDVTDQRAVEARLAALSEHDELTGLLNRRGFTQRVEYGLRAANRARRRDTLICLDLDQFKPINDSYGHAAGDVALKAIGEIIRGTIRGTDFAGRVGGDEFAIYAVGLDTAAESGSAVAGGESVLVSRLQRALARHNAVQAAQGRPYELAFSVGVAQTRPEDSRDSLLARADVALYAMKKARR